MTAYYYGCWQQAGHYLFDEKMHHVREAMTPWGSGIDTTRHLSGGATGRQGRAVVRHKDGWTALSFLDRSVDHRGGSHSTFVFDEELPFEVALDRAKETFPKVFARFTFTVEED